MSRPESTEKSLWKQLITQMAVNTLVYAILTSATVAVMFTFFLPFIHEVLPGEHLEIYGNIITGVLTVIFIAPFLRAMIMKKNRSEEWRQLWEESNKNRLPLLFTILVRVVIAVAYIFFICHRLSHLTNAIVITIGVMAVALMVVSRTVKQRSIKLERLFMLNLRSRDIEAQVHGKKRPLYEGRLLDRDIHIADFDVPMNSQWMGSTLKQLNLGRKYGVHVSSILRANFRLNIPDGDYVIFPGDRLQVIGSDEQVSKFAHAIKTEVIGEDFDLENREMKLRQLIIGEGSPFIGKNLKDSGIRNLYSCMVIGLEEGKENLSRIDPNRRFEEGDILWIVGEQESLDALFGTDKD
jgi:CPA2 family monovalent cation:H+ antiporter-2